ncbi:MAG TPA: winged helix-turn-helix domain-containing protein, partial [Pyrinomonadaceae bacterium]|nr:winged helix-turn-helix domain-containing protein [Pyrinomonadaceae bacterium]
MRLRFRDCVLDTGVRTLARSEQPVPLSPKAFHLLEVLAERRPNAVSQDDLRKELWPDTVMGGTTIARLVSELRAAIGDDRHEPIIRTVHRFGYAFAELATEEHVGPAAVIASFAIQWGSQLVPLCAGENLIGRSP